MRLRELGRTGVHVSEVGFGAWAIGGASYGPVDRTDALAALARAEELGCNFVDTAAVYGDSESILGAFLRGRRDRWIVATKYSGQEQGLTATAEDQLRRLGLSHIDFYQIHWAPGPAGHGLYDELHALKKAGKARLVGVSLNSVTGIDYVLDRGLVDAFQVPFSLVQPRPFLERLERIRDEGVGVVVRSSLAAGLLTGKYDSDVRFTDPNDHRRELNGAEIRRALGLVDRLRFLSEGEGSMTAAAVRYALSFPEVSTVIVGTKSREQAEDNFGVVPGGSLGEEALAAIRSVQDQAGLLRDSLARRSVRTVRRVLRRLGAGRV